MKKLSAVAVLVLALLAMTTTAWASGSDDAEEGITLGVIYLTLEHPYYQAHQRWTQIWAEEKGIKLIELDGQIDAAVMASQVENLIAQQVDGIIYCLIDPSSAVADINAAQAAGIPVVTFAIKHDTAADAPFVGIPEYEGAKLGGIEAAKMFQERFPGQNAKVAVITQPAIPAVVDRSDGFYDGFKSVISDAELVASMNGEGLREAAFNVTEDLLQSHPEVNVFYGANGDMGLGALAALESAGRGTIDTELVVSHDGSEPEVLKIIDERSALKLAVANRPKALALGTIETMMEILAGEREMTDTSDVMVTATVLENDIDSLQAFIAEQYFSETDLKASM